MFQYNAPQNISCPGCHSQNVKKVSVIVGEGTQFSRHRASSINTELTTVWGLQTGIQQTILAQQLAGPQKPRRPKLLWWALGAHPAFLWLLVFFAPLSKRMRLVTAAVLYCGLFSALLSALFSQSPVLWLLLLIYLITLFLGTILYLIGVIREVNRKRLDYDRVELPKWYQMMSKWNELYFCFTDGSVFNLAEGKCVTAANMRSLLV